MNAIDSKILRNTLGAFTTGVTVITTLGADGRRYGVTANSFSSVSLAPPLVLWSQSTTSRSHPAFRDTERFVVNILAVDQIHVSDRFAKSGDDKFDGVEIDEGVAGLPIIRGASAFLECRKMATYPGGDHVVFLGLVENVFRGDRPPLAFRDGKYLTRLLHDLAEA
ncbi:3-hydroxy-9,10-secoandrosta-1,3,5(10)-triene-9,17-dione monooxygenase reductase component [Paraburkholderia fungorum]|uniref:3-hydroxy-9,10-secoandrosta-1,3,5(10)-triene-9,17-dione monooxygenase reductase component n=1 Tax=Paraburkholderia fungorum TaxID=134537 RepID=A0A1H1JER3_9BURK|nr:flavin reductase family protein [Paraburkholderia fungorum]SDR48230.1 3-hydroxy-9,10-secoandrosta-1,3,5(10)-triene-9,17-dione monooxygenase reductase component [Paraburkholderia fungorum]